MSKPLVELLEQMKRTVAILDGHGDYHTARGNEIRLFAGQLEAALKKQREEWAKDRDVNSTWHYGEGFRVAMMACINDLKDEHYFGKTIPRFAEEEECQTTEPINQNLK